MPQHAVWESKLAPVAVTGPMSQLSSAWRLTRPENRVALTKAIAVKVLHHARCLLPAAFDDILYSSVVDSCGKGFVWDHALDVLGNAKHYSLQGNAGD